MKWGKREKKDLSVCEFESLSAWPHSSRRSLNMEACVPEPAYQSDNAYLTIHTHTGMHACKDALTARLRSGWQALLKEPRVLLN